MKNVCPQCGTAAVVGQAYCGRCGERLIRCANCRASNLASSLHCHNCGKPFPPRTETAKDTLPNATRIPELNIEERVLKYLSDHRGEISITRAAQELGMSLQELTGILSRLQSKGSIQKESAFVERMRNCVSCKKAIGADELFCSYCGTKQATVQKDIQPSLDPRTMKVTLTMLSRIIEAKDHSEYSEIDQLTTTIGSVALGGEKAQDAQELSFQDQLRLLTLVFEYSRDKVVYKGETFGEHVRWPWETIKTGGDCDCKVVLLASMLASLAFRRMYLLVLPAGKYVDAQTDKETSMPGHAILEVELSDNGRSAHVRLDPSCPDCDVDEMAALMEPLLPNFYRVPIIP